MGRVNRQHENTAFKYGFTKPVLEANGIDPLGQDGIPNQRPVDDLQRTTEERRLYLNDLLGPVNCIKDPKLALVWESLDAAYPDAQWVVIWRDPQKCAESCVRMPILKLHKTQAAWQAWILRYRGLIQRIVAQVPSERVHEIDATVTYTNGDYTALAGAVAACGLNWDEGAVERVLRPEWWTG